LALFGVVALILAATGIYGVTAFSVARRRREIGLRIALGAEPSGVRWMVVGRALRLAASGIVVGVGAALVLARFLDALLYEAVSPADPTTFVAVSLAAGLLAIVST
ncbi:MAG: FtsX-like permease family protein, partial [Gammaproteobacteria bacterium]|nr:FtsX-like permease family protein [Gemmatimonadota bacterium]NIU77892.1 FtsX-like permease family protein [Gammaproteobacteria bacterium]NIY11360.1 FtsX-like permease family protein [Gemmatimonadota bacterium]